MELKMLRAETKKMFLCITTKRKSLCNTGTNK